MPTSVLLAALAGAGLVAATGLAPASAEPSLPAPWTSRVLLVSAPRASDPLLGRQRAAFAQMGAGARERDLVLVEAIGDHAAAEALRRRFDLDPAAFVALLIGKDGGVKLRSAGVLGAAQLFPTIDAMPMRRSEMGE